MKKYYTQTFLILIFSGIFSNVFSAVLLRQDGVTDIPVAPVNITAEALSASEIAVSWEYNDDAAKINHFFVERSENLIAPDFEEIARGNKHTRSVIDDNLLPASTYYYRVTAGGADGDSEPSSIVEATTLLAAPNAPTGLSATGIDISTIRLSWSHDMANVEKFVIERRDLFTYEEIAEVPATVTSYDDEGLLLLVNYSYRVKAVLGAESSDYSNVASSTTAIIPTVPAAPSNLTASTVTSGSIELKWIDNADNEDNYVLERGEAQGGPFEETTLPPNTETITDVDLVPNSTYFYKVKATNGQGSSDYTATIEASTLDVAPAAPSGLTATPLSSTSINLQWTDNATNETGFVLERSATSAASGFEVIQETAADASSFEDTGLAPNTTYYYRVMATNAVDDSDYTSTVEAKTLDVAPEPPSGLQITAKTSSTITLSWADNSDNETGFVLEKSSTSATDDFEPLTTTAPNVITYEATGLSPNTTYYFRIKAINGVGESIVAAVTGKTDDVAPVAPSELQIAAKTSSTITLSWTDNSDNETAFVVERSLTSASEEFTPIKTTAANAVSFEDTNLSSNTPYYYRVKATNAVGDSDYISVSGKTNDVAPTTPSGLQITSKDAHTINLKWTDNSDNEVDFVLEKSVTSASSGFTPEATLPANTTTYQDSDLISNTTYYYRIKATNAVGESGYSAAVAGKTDIDKPLTPTNLSAGEITTSSIALSWTDNSTNEAGFELVRSLQSTTGYVLVAELPANTTAFVDEDLASNTTYFYKVRAINKDGASPYGNTVSPTTAREAGPPAAPSLLKATAITTFQINLSWQDNSDNETSFVVERSPSETGEFKTVATLPANTSFYENTGLDPNTTYYYRVKARNIDGAPVSNTSSATTMANPTPPKAPSALSAIAVSTVQINLTWVDNSNSETNFTIQRAPALDGPYQLVASVGANVTSYQNFGLTPNTTYYYRVRAESGDGVSAYTNIDNAKTSQAAQPPSAPSSLIAVGVSTKQINLQWIDNSNSETNFIIERAATLDGTYSFIAAVGANETSYQNTGLSTNTEYFYKVRAINNDGTSGYSNAASATTLEVRQPPVAPSSLVANGVSTTQINLSWEDNSVSETNFEIHRASSAEGPFSFLVNVAANQTSYENTGLQANTTYHYQVRASNGDGPSQFSNVAEGTTSEQAQPPAAPDGLTALAVSTTQIILEWNDKAFNETVYEIERSTNGLDFTIAGTVQANDTVFQNFGLTPVTEYTYRVRAQNGDGVSGYSNTATAVTLENEVPPIAPSDLFVKPLSQSEVELFWTDNSVNEEEFIVERAELETEDQTTANFAIVELLPSNTITYNDTGLQPNTIYKYRIQAKNSDGISYSNEFVIITSVGGNPVIVAVSNYPRYFSNQDKDTVISIEVAEPELYQSVLFYYRGLNEDEYNTDIPVTINGNIYSVTIGKDHLDEMGIEYYFEALDSEDNAAVSAKGLTYWKMENPGLTIPDLKFGASVSDYQMISIPLVLAQRRIVDVFEDDLGAYDPSLWRLFHFDEGAMLERGAFIDILPGHGYWLIVKENDTINTGAGNVVEAHSGEPFKLELKKGWNQIGNPYMFGISWNEVMQANDSPEFIGPLISYNGTYAETQTLEVFKGAYVHAGEATTIVLPIGVQEAGAAGRYTTAVSERLKSEQQVDKGWSVDFSLSSSDMVYNLSGLGMHSQASKSKDKFDRIALPKLPSYLDINFSHPEYFSPEFTRDIVPLQDSHVWDMKVVSSFGDRPVTITWEKADQVPLDMNLILFDPSRQKKIDMKSVGEYEVSGEVALQVYYGDDEFISENLQTKEVYLGAVYPNPFSDVFSIPVALPESELPYIINVVLYNNIGKRIAKPYHFSVDGGFQDIHLSGNALLNLNDGLYFYKIKISQDGNVLKEEVGRIIKK